MEPPVKKLHIRVSEVPRYSFHINVGQNMLSLFYFIFAHLVPLECV